MSVTVCRRVSVEDRCWQRAQTALSDGQVLSPIIMRDKQLLLTVGRVTSSLGTNPRLSKSIQMISATVCILQRRNYGVKPMAHTISNLKPVCGASRSQQ